MKILTKEQAEAIKKLNKDKNKALESNKIIKK